VQDELPDFGAILAKLNAAGVRYVVIGGLAMVGHGSDHVTRDIDIGYARDRTNLQHLASALKSVSPRPRDFPADLPFIWDERTIQSLANMTLDTESGWIDLLGDIPGIDEFDALWEHAVEVEMFGQDVRIASVEDMILMKRAANREKDQKHISELIVLKELTDSPE
jgi:predicted nucleotidyltransferase